MLLIATIGMFVLLNASIIGITWNRDRLIPFYNFILYRILHLDMRIKSYRYYSAEQEEKDLLILITRILTYNALLGLFLLGAPLIYGHSVRFSFVIVLSGILYIVGRCRESMFVDIEKQYATFKKQQPTSDTQRRNDILAQALVEAEHTIKRLEKEKSKRNRREKSKTLNREIGIL